MGSVCVGPLWPVAVAAAAASPLAHLPPSAKARMVAAATNNLCEAANAAVQGHASEEKLISSAKQVAASTAQLLVACKVKADQDSEAMKRLQVRRAEAAEGLREQPFPLPSMEKLREGGPPSPSVLVATVDLSRVQFGPCWTQSGLPFLGPAGAGLPSSTLAPGCSPLLEAMGAPQLPSPRQPDRLLQ